MTYVTPNSVQARDIASIVHPQTNLVRHLEQGPMVIGRGDGCYIYDDNGKKFIDTAAGLWCASLGYASERLARVAYEQMRKLGYYHLYRGTTNEPGVDLAERLLAIAPGAENDPLPLRPRGLLPPAIRAALKQRAEAGDRSGSLSDAEPTRAGSADPTHR